MPKQAPEAMHWRRLDVPGTDRCALTRSSNGWRLAGRAAFEDVRGEARLDYAVAVDGRWQTLTGSVHGVVGRRPVALEVERGEDARWVVNGTHLPDLDGLVDLDLGFTPATNLFPLRRLALRVGEAADAAAAWLDDEQWMLRRLPQRYERRAPDAWWYESPLGGYEGLLRVNAAGFVTEYPGLWEAVPE
ncbi:MAG: putative glycolipid-binding domain-containing protein [Gemmatimonadota bacterium]